MANGFDVWLVTFEPHARDPAGALSDAFGIERRKAARLVDGLPRVVKRGVSQVAAQQYAEALRQLGARVEVRGGGQAGPRTTGRPDAATSAMGGRHVRPSGERAEGSTRARRSSLDDGREADVRHIAQIVGGGEAPYAWLTYSLMAWMTCLGGAAILGLEVWLRANAFLHPVELPDLLITWVGGSLATSGLIEGIYGAVKRRSLRATLPVAAAWLAGLVGLQLMYGSPLLG